jgi:hypothetical protein
MNSSLIQRQKNNQSAGYLMILVLVFSGIFITILSGFVGYVITQNKLVNFRYEQQRATEIAEAGLNYYKWYLAHYPNDLTTGIGTPHPYKDPVSGTFFGEFTLQVASTTYCGAIASIEVESTAFTYSEPDAKSTVRARYTRPTVAEFSFITNSSVWYGPDRVITGPVHSNQGIRMDGYHNSAVGSGQSTWTCDSSFGCSTNTTVPGVYTTSGHATPGLFQFPISPVDFTGITLDLNEIKTKAQSPGGIYYGPSGASGYRVTFNSGGTITVRRVNSTTNYNAQSTTEGWHTERNVIATETLLGTNSISASCPILYFEDKVWLEGEISQKVTLAAANLSSGAQTNIVLNNNIYYTPGSISGLLAIAEDDIDVGLVVPNNMRADGIYIAQNGRFGRNHYTAASLSPNTLDPYVFRGTLTQYGSVISNGRVGTQWTSGGVMVSGFANRINSFDLNQVSNPPPITPETSDVYTFKDWRHD